ncbi:VanZ family protein [Modestobacter versicolor]|uniref:VanZ family protein n=1 Tax=Modestobacter versicolor TaxID=429133 RepID=UPI0034DFE80A
MIEESLGRMVLTGSGGAVLATTGLLAVLALAGAALTPPSRSPSVRLLVAGTGLSLAVVLGLTVVPTGGWQRFGVAPGALDSIARNLRPLPGDLTAWTHTSDGPPNVALFVPLGLFLALLLRRPLAAAAAAVVLSAAIECYQAALTTRVGAFADVVANGLGGLLGAALAGVLLLLLPRDRGDGHAGRAGRRAAVGTLRG